jgi:hypothetical protein
VELLPYAFGLSVILRLGETGVAGTGRTQFSSQGAGVAVGVPASVSRTVQSFVRLIRDVSAA